MPATPPTTAPAMVPTDALLSSLGRAAPDGLMLAEADAVLLSDAPTLKLAVGLADTDELALPLEVALAPALSDGVPVGVVVPVTLALPVPDAVALALSAPGAGDGEADALYTQYVR